MEMDYILSLTKALLQGATLPLVLFVVVLVVSLPLGFFITLITRSKIAILRWVTNSYIYIMRGTPLLLQLLFIMFGLPNLPVVGRFLVLDRFPAALLGFILNYAAYFAEIFRGGLLSVDKGQYEAAHVLGLTKWQTTTRVILPQMFRVALPSITNESITLVKDTALMYAVAVPEILHYAKAAVTRDSNTTAFLVAGVIYLVINSLLQMAFSRIEKKFDY